MNANDKNIKVLNFLQSNLVGVKMSKFSTIQFFFSDSTLITIWFQVLEYNYKEENLSLEDLYKSLPNISRPTIYKNIQNSIFNGFVLKMKNKIDKRKYNLKPSLITTNEFENFSKQLKKVLN